MHRWQLVVTLLVLGVSASLRPTAGLAGTLDPGTCNGLEPTIVGWIGEDEVVYGTGGPDVIIVTFLNGGPNGFGGSTVYGNGGNDTICVHYEYTTVFGGSGNDWISGAGPDGYEPDSLGARLSNGLAKGKRVTGDGLFGESGHDYITFAELIDGGSGNDYLYYADEMYGAAGNDTLESAVFCDGGSGTDTAIDCEIRIRVEKVESMPPI